MTEIIKKSEISPDTIYKDIDSDDHVKRIYAALDVKKMIPVDSSLYQVVDLSFDEDMDDAIKNYKILQNKEYRACVNMAVTKERLTRLGLVSMADYYAERCVTC